jgi:hypothetical protein
MIPDWANESLPGRFKKACGEMSLRLGEPGNNALRNLEPKPSKEGMGEEVEGMTSEPSLATKLFLVVVEKEGMSPNRVHRSGNRPVIPGGEGSELMSAAFIDSLGNT